MEAVRQPRCAVDVEVPADRVGTICLQGVKRIDSVSFGLTHLLSVLILNVAENDNVLVRRLIKEQRRLSHCKKGSSRYMKQKKKIARLHAHIARQRKDYLHKESRKITNFYDLVCIESLNMKEMSQDSRFGKSVHDNGWGMFTEFLSYKLERAGKKLVRIDKWYPSSKICSCCGKLKKELKLEDRIYSCTCGNQMNRDENAAINICREGLRISGVELDTERKIS